MAYAPTLLTLPADHPRTCRVIALGLGVLTTAAFAPFGLSLLGPLCILPLLFTCLTLAPRDAGWCAFWYGMGLFVSGTYWIYISVVVFGEAPAWIAMVLMFGLAAIMSSWLFLCAYLVCRAAAGESMRLVLVAPAAWVLVEWLRGWVATGFPWLAIGYSQTDSPLAGFAPVGGIYLVSFAAVLSAAALLAVFMHSGTRRRVALAVAIAPWLLGAALGPVEWTAPAGEPVRVTILQAGIPQDQKWLPQNREPTKAFYREKTKSVRDSDLVVWPEVAIPSLLGRERRFVASLQADAAASGQTVLFGILEDVEARGERNIYNSVILLDGQREQAYRKRHLVPFGEYFPVPQRVREWMRMMSLPHSDLSPGDDVQPLLTTRGGVRLAAMVCYEDAYNGEQLYALPAANLLVNVSNDAWFGDSIAPHQHLQIARMRSLEAGRPAVRATNTGISAFIDHRGALLEAGEQFAVETMTASLQPRAGSTPFASAGNVPVIILCLLLLGFYELRTRR
jgi:apolipoprotein N-acyltransferase